ncbi:helix-turn-helix domain-containing protein [Priestia megaterium]|uniref:helix-turn-helix domain-containing protein n=1 Tax=Priestia megaterium TaxID=1404 RepID=UPI0011B73432|nr:helix-turn-helix transcriptional regulator [Priestia megaterium]QDZ88739.1 XRE family transcriptional regulator [Priestia megaterium]
MEDKNRIPYNQEFDHRFIKPIRHLRNKTQADFEQFMGVDKSTIGKLERGELEFTPLYHSKLKDAIKRLRVSSIEIASVRKIIEMKTQRGYK